MPATNHTPDDAASITAGHAITWFTPTATDGDTFINTTGRVQVLVRNDSADTPTTITIDAPVACSRGYYHDVEKVLAFGASWISTILSVSVFADPTNSFKTLVTCTAVTDVLMAFVDTSFSPSA
jgi:hypothetical protein